VTAPPKQVADDASATSLACYEELRLGVLKGSARDGHVGWGLFLREGMAAWMARPPTGAATAKSVMDSEQRAAPLVMDALRSGVVIVLASMALSAREEMSA
jgi:hypothetical protein